MLQARCQAVRVRRMRSSRAAASRTRPGSRLGGRPARSRQSAEGWPPGRRVADGEAQVAQRGFVGVDAQDFGRGRGALQRQAGAQRACGGRIAAETGIQQERGRRRRRTADRPALPFRSPGPRMGPALAAKGCFAAFFARIGALARASRAAQERALPGSGSAVGEQLEVGANHTAHGESSAALCHVV